MKRALIVGISGQDGAYLADFLLKKGYQIFGSSRDVQGGSFYNLERLGIRDKVALVSINTMDFRSIIQAFKKTSPNEIYNLSGQSSVALSFDQPVETLESIASGTLNLLEAIRFMDCSIKFYNAGSGESFGNTGGQPADENTPFRPCSPYGVAKATAFWEVANYRDAYQIYAATGILFNHESPLRPTRFVTQKIINAACRIAGGSMEKLQLGNLDVERDWGWAPEYVEAMWKILQQPTPEDFVIATGTSSKLSDFVAKVFSYLNLDWMEYVEINSAIYRPSDIMISRANPTKAKLKMGWVAEINLEQVIGLMIKDRLNNLSTA